VNEALARLGHRALLALPPERAHELGVSAVERGWVPDSPAPDRPVRAFGVEFRNPLGLAAGFDKDARAVSHWHRLGFGFVEVGTVTRHAQPGNPRPRLFRLPRHTALINRLGFNNQGADAMARRLEASDPQIPVGVNLGKSKATPDAEAAEDYLYSFRLLAPLADYVVVNVSSPNTPGLRSLQAEAPLRRIVSTLREHDPDKPLLVKLSPDLDEEGLDAVARVAVECGLAGLVATNTTLSRQGLGPGPWPEGGLSGTPLRPIADAALAHLASLGTGLVLVGVGGVNGRESFQRKQALGATLVQAYTGFVYGGPRFVHKALAP
jgi:dihydroorotate dehydrogenase